MRSTDGFQEVFLASTSRTLDFHPRSKFPKLNGGQIGQLLVKESQGREMISQRFGNRFLGGIECSNLTQLVWISLGHAVFDRLAGVERFGTVVLRRFGGDRGVSLVRTSLGKLAELAPVNGLNEVDEVDGPTENERGNRQGDRKVEDKFKFHFDSLRKVRNQSGRVSCPLPLAPRLTKGAAADGDGEEPPRPAALSGRTFSQAEKSLELMSKGALKLFSNVRHLSHCLSAIAGWQSPELQGDI